MIRCDDEGVPKIVQEISYDYKYHSFLCTLFDGMYYRVPTHMIYRCDEMNPTELNYREVECHAINYYMYRKNSQKVADSFRRIRELHEKETPESIDISESE